MFNVDATIRLHAVMLAAVICGSIGSTVKFSAASTSTDLEQCKPVMTKLGLMLRTERGW